MSKIGIDLGTTNSLAAYWTENGPKIIPNTFGENLTPSVVSVDGKTVLVGKTAKERLLTHPSDTVAAFKRMMGTQKVYTLGQQIFSPVDLSSFVLRSLKEDAEAFLNEPVTEAIVSVPAYFNDIQRKATQRAAQLAGLHVERIVNEPTAAAIAYGFSNQTEEATIMVIDLGGGTLDVSILELFEGVMQVKAIAGDNRLGGEDFTRVLMDHFVLKSGLDMEGLGHIELSQLYKQAETCKCALGTSNRAKMNVCIAGRDFEMQMDPAVFEALSETLINRMNMPIMRAMRDAGYSIYDLDAVVLVGGATRMLFVRSMVSRMTGRLPHININPDEAVAFGTAIQLALKEKNEALNEIILTDVCPYTLGINVARLMETHTKRYESGYYMPIIDRNTPIPVSRVRTISSIEDYQRTMCVSIFQGESRRNENNIKIGELMIPLPPAPAGVPADVRFTYDINGILEVEATVNQTGISKRLVINNLICDLTPEQIEKRLTQLSELKILPREKAENRYLLEWGERLYQECSGENRDKLDQLLTEFEKVLETQDTVAIKQFADMLTDILGNLERLLQ